MTRFAVDLEEMRYQRSPGGSTRSPRGDAGSRRRNECSSRCRVSHPGAENFRRGGRQCAGVRVAAGCARITLRSAPGPRRVGLRGGAPTRHPFRGQRTPTASRPDPRTPSGGERREQCRELVLERLPRTKQERSLVLASDVEAIVDRAQHGVELHGADGGGVDEVLAESHLKPIPPAALSPPGPTRPCGAKARSPGCDGEAALAQPRLFVRGGSAAGVGRRWCFCLDAIVRCKLLLGGCRGSVLYRTCMMPVAPSGKHRARRQARITPDRRTADNGEPDLSAPLGGSCPWTQAQPSRHERVDAPRPGRCA
jgi:hypothetical protein